MKLLIDIGNTNTSLALTEGERIVKRYFISTSKKEVAPESLRRLFGKNASKIDDIVIVSVVPKFLSVIKRSLKTIVPKVTVRTMGKNIKVPIKIKYKDPRQVGQDRLVTALSAKEAYGLPVLVIDFGTAVTFDMVGENGEYEGGLIFPGLRLGLEALTKHAALLPDIDLRPTTGLIGRDTDNSMNKGLLFGYASMCDGMIKRFSGKYGRNLKVVATGGDAQLVAKYSTHIKNIQPDLMINGLLFLSEAPKSR